MDCATKKEVYQERDYQDLWIRTGVNSQYTTGTKQGGVEDFFIKCVARYGTSGIDPTRRV